MNSTTTCNQAAMCLPDDEHDYLAVGSNGTDYDDDYATATHGTADAAEPTTSPLMERLESPAHHAAHWIMLWSQSHYLGQAVSAAMLEGVGVSKEILVSMFGIIFIALGIVASGFVVVSEFRALRDIVGIEKGNKNEAVHRWCMVLAGSSSLVFSALQVFAAAVVPAEDGDCLAVLLFRLTGILWGGVSAFLWYTLSCRRQTHTSKKCRLQSSTELMV